MNDLCLSAILLVILTRVLIAPVHVTGSAMKIRVVSGVTLRVHTPVQLRVE